ncbi:MAG: hypothetical protein V4543_09385 [Bacteroidota bacterium]
MYLAKVNKLIFHALALLLNCTLVTNDKKHYLKTKDIIGSVVMLEDVVV